MPKYVVTGIKEIDRALKELAPKLGRKIVKSAMKKAMAPVEAAAEANAPVDTGLLQSSIKMRASKKSRNSFGIDVRIGEKDWAGKSWYGAAQEYGTSKMPGKGFLRKAYDEKKDESKAIAIRELLDGLNQELQRAG